VNQPAWWSVPWWSWFLTIVLAGVLAGVLSPAFRGLLAWGWRNTLHERFILLVEYVRAGRHHCGHRSARYSTDRNGRRTCMKCFAAQVLRESGHDR
jgi:hypothetical protein